MCIRCACAGTVMSRIPVGRESKDKEIQRHREKLGLRRRRPRDLSATRYCIWTCLESPVTNPALVLNRGRSNWLRLCEFDGLGSRRQCPKRICRQPLTNHVRPKGPDSPVPDKVINLLALFITAGRIKLGRQAVRKKKKGKPRSAKVVSNIRRKGWVRA
ncbi:hypothetical protein SODALDRAFT_86013 [Sodiomyces alkalinus F11]|uniref:Uncharacterized protein n=1 Tax=Sodiomyces alkalinus (strain CBS 110278 / VKM F-3762 / F11) TaxID=1314773 RepID=A0A3N2PJH2_SODAK|nr:hypothetical protein SODALDRAFT_86013 [Sodiomyces alkalinus F11]ROT34580.1 hypothetical protein SODALDRAFT_86013 [Sodiomyces alkalinus F11]